MPKILFRPEEYRALSDTERQLLAEGYLRAIEVVRKNVTPKGFSACSLTDNVVYGTDANYRSVWARDGAITALWTIDLEDEDIRQAQIDTFDTLLLRQGPNGQIPANVNIETGEAEYAGVGGIASIDSVMWIIIGIVHLCEARNDWSLAERHAARLQKAMDWLAAHDSNNCGLLEIPEASDWADLFGFSYHVLYDEVLWYRSLDCYSRLVRQLGDHERADDYEKHTRFVRQKFLRTFWPTTTKDDGVIGHSFTDTQYALGDARYLVAQVSPFSYSWRCDVCGNLLAFLTGLLDENRALMTFRFLWGSGVNDPGPVKNLYPPVQAGDPEWRSYYTVNLLNLPNHYHNGGLWPFIGSMWVRFIHRLGLGELAQRELVKLARTCQLGTSHPWEFNEWHHGVTGRPMGKAYQAWSAAGFIRACHDLEAVPSEISHAI
jgi:glycogen debranching enzyme